MEPVAIIGIGCRFPSARNPQAFWELLRQGGDAIREVPKDRWDLDGFYDPDPSAPGKMNTRWGGFLDRVDEFDAAFFRITPREAAQVDPQQRLLLQVAWEAVEDAGLALEKIAGSSTGVFVGIMNADYSIFSHQDLCQIDVHSGPGNGFSIAANRLSYVFDFRGPSIAVDTACASSLTAVHLACASLQRECNLALAGGVNVILSPWGSIYFSKAGLMASDGRCKAFDASANGIVRSEGAGMVVLKRLSDALADGDPIYAVIRGTAINHDGRTNGITAPNRWAQEAVIREAYRAAGVSPGQVQYVETHGTGTALGDPIEAAALGTVLATDRPPESRCLIGSVKSNIGHLESAAGMAGLIKVVLSLQHKQIPPSLHFNTPNPYIPFDKLPLVVAKQLMPWPQTEGPLLAGVSGFGFGGANAHIVIEEFRTGTSVRQRTLDHLHLLTLSARSHEALRDFAQAYACFLAGDGASISLDDICYTASARRTHHEHRLALVGRTREELTARLESFLNGQADSAISTGRSVPGRRRKLVFVFPGQGSQWLGMGRQLLDKELVFGEAMRRCEQAMQPHVDWRLIEELTGDHAASRLEEIDFIQPALFAIQVSLAALWRSWGIEPDAVVGHSLGEVAAAHVAGALSLPDAAHVICARSRLMERVSGQGAMAVVELPLDQAREALAGYEGRVSIAVCNSPTSTVLSGDPVALQEVLNRLQQRDVFCRMVKVDVAAHSSHMDPLRGELVDEVSGVRPQPTSTPIYSTVTGAAIQGESLDAAYWGRNLREPVLFSTAVQQLVDDGHSIFIEISPHPILLSAITSSNLQSPVPNTRYPIMALPSLRREQNEQAALLAALGALYTLGLPIGWNALYPDGGQCVRLPSYPWQSERYWLDVRAAGAEWMRAPSVESQPEQLIAVGEVRLVPGLAGAIRQASDPQAREQLLREYLLKRLSHVFKLPAARLDAQQPINSYGLDSLMALELKTGLERDLGVSVPLVKFFQNLNADQLAVFSLEQMMSGQAVAPTQEFDRYRITPAPEARYELFALTDVQQAYWIGRSDLLVLGNIACHVYAEIEFDDFDLDRFNAAWQMLIERHDMLRTIVLPDGRQQVLEHVPPYQIEALDLRGTDAPQVAAQLDAVREQLSHQMLPADQWPLFEIRASHLSERRTRLHISLDALIADAWSLAIMDREVTHLYRHPDEPLPPLDLTFRDYVTGSKAIEQSELYRRSWDYWQKRLPTLPPAPDLPLAKNPASVTKPFFTRRSAPLDPEAWQRIKERVRGAGVTPSGLLMAAFAEVLTTWSKSPRFTVNLTLFNRLPLHPQVNNILGDFTSLTLLEVDNSIQDTFEARARRLQEQLWQDLDHRYVGGVQVQRELARLSGGADKAAMPVVFTSTLVQEAWGGQGSLLLGEGEHVFGVSQTPQVWLDHQVFERNDGTLVLNWDAVEELFPAGMLDDMLQAYRSFLQRLADDPETWRVTAPELIPAHQREQRAVVNATQAPVPPGLLHEPFLAQAAQRPDQLAVITPLRTLTYDELYRRSNQVGRRLRELGTRPNRLVGVVMEKGWEQLVAVMGVLASGAAYLPIDPALPAERIGYLLEHGQVEIALTQPWLEDKLQWPQDIRRIVLGNEPWQDVDESPLDVGQTPGDLAYVIFTSGSTGLPKGVMINHRGALNTCVDINQRFHVQPCDRVLALSSLNFDLSVYDIFGVLGAGGTVVMPLAEARRDPAHWLELIEQAHVTLWDTVPALMEMLVEYVEGRGDKLPPHLRLVMMSGDWIPVTLPDRIRKLAQSEIDVISLGGATEASIWSILYPIGEVDPAWKSIPYGKPMVNQTFNVLNERLEPCPVLVPGQLVIGGIGLAQGYWRDEEKTRASFITRLGTGERLYRTGDLGRYLPDGNLEFLGRQDFQVKIGGYRIELGEIESALQQHPAVRVAVVNAVGERHSKRLVAYVVPNQEFASALKPAHPQEEKRLEDFDQSLTEGVTLLDPLARIEFKLKQPGIRHDNDRLTLQLVKPELDDALRQAYVERRTYREFATEPIPLAQFSEFLSCLYHIDLDGLPKYRYGSAGGLYPVQTYLHVKPNRIEGLQAGTYYYHPTHHQLVSLAPEPDLDRALHAPGNRPIFDEAAFTIFLVGQLNAIRPMYGKQAHDYCVIEAGYMSQLLMMVSPKSGLGLCPIGDMEFEPIRQLFALDEGHFLAHTLLGGMILPEQAHGWAAEQKTFAHTRKRTAALASSDDLVGELRQFLQSKVPAYMVPSTFMLLESLPLTANGKVNRSALPDPEVKPQQQQAVAFVAPQTELEQMLAAIAQEVLQVEQVGIYSSFFDLGGTSVHMVQMIGKLRDALGREVPVTELFRHPTIHALAEYLSQSQAEPPSFEKSGKRADLRRAAMSRRSAQRQERGKRS